jgi:hypothetical protein
MKADIKLCGSLEKTHNEELHNLYASANVIRMIKKGRVRWAGYVARMGQMRNSYKILVAKSEGKTLLGRPRHRWEDSIRIDLKEIGWEGVD